MITKKIIFILFINSFLAIIKYASAMDQEFSTEDPIYSHSKNNLLDTNSQSNNELIMDLNLNDCGIKIFELKFKKNIDSIKIKNNFLIINFSDSSKKLINLSNEKIIFKNAKNLVFSHNGKLLFAAKSNAPSKLIDLEKEKQFIIEKPNPYTIIFSKNNMYFLSLYKNFLVDLRSVEEKQYSKEEFRNVIEAKFTKNSNFLSIKHQLSTQIIDLKTMNILGVFSAYAKLSNTGKFLYGKIKPNFILDLFNKFDKSSMKKMDFSSPHVPKLVNLENMSILKRFNRWGEVNFSENDKFIFICNANNYNKDKFRNDKNKNLAKLIKLNENRTIRSFDGSCISKFNKQETLAIILQKEDSLNNENLAELICTESGKCLQKFNNICLYDSKFSKNSKFLKLRFKDNSKKIINLDNNFEIIKANENENCGLTGNFAWLQNKNDTLKIINLSTEIQYFKKNLLDKCNKKDETKHNYFNDVRINTLS